MTSRRKTIWSAALLCGCAALVYVSFKGFADKKLNSRLDVAPTSTHRKPQSPQDRLQQSPLPHPVSAAFIAGSSLPEIRTRVRQRIADLIVDPANPNLRSDRFRNVFSVFIHPSLETKLEGLAPEHESGHALPGECDPFGSEALPIFTSLQDRGEVPFASGPIEQESLLGIFSLFMIQAGAGGRELPSLLEERANHLPPTKADFLVCMAARESLQMVNRTSGPLTAEQFDAWKRLAIASNPIYRAVALLGLSRVGTDRQQLTEFYSTFRHERDTRLFTEAVQRLGQVPTTEAQTKLQQMRQVASDQGRLDAVRVVDEAMRHQDTAIKMRANYEGR